MNYQIQSKRVKPNAKSCDWCQHKTSCFDSFNVFDIPLTHRQKLKIKREEALNYCKNYRYSKVEFENWKNERKQNKKLTWV